jgi:hypothetical protein
MNVVEKEWDQLDTRLARYDQNCERTSGGKSRSDIVRWSRTLSGGARHCPTGSFWSSKLRDGPCSGHVGHCPVGGLWKMRFSPKIRIFLPKFDS